MSADREPLGDKGRSRASRWTVTLRLLEDRRVESYEARRGQGGNSKDGEEGVCVSLIGEMSPSLRPVHEGVSDSGEWPGSNERDSRVNVEFALGRAVLEVLGCHCEVPQPEGGAASWNDERRYSDARVVGVRTVLSSSGE